MEQGSFSLGVWGNPKEDLAKQTTRPYLQSSVSVGLGWGAWIWISNMFPGDADAVGLGITVRAAVVLRPIETEPGDSSPEFVFY